ncbi:MAG TPA: antibiotic biosynthesis monooxygenase family protein [Steroidobacteraceae bacterium]|nr:antibiotic biosynthesis monooxygenase family protein [Steroidobacteraceae bacterium]
MKTMAWLRGCAVGAALIVVCSLPLGACAAAQAQGAAQSLAAGAPAVAGPFILMIQLHVKPDREQDFLALLKRMTQRVKTQDHGNIRYELFAVAPLGNAAAAPEPAINYVFLEEWRDQAAATAHGKWAGPIVRTQWRDMSDRMQLIRLSRVPAR